MHKRVRTLLTKQRYHSLFICTLQCAALVTVIVVSMSATLHHGETPVAMQYLMQSLTTYRQLDAFDIHF